MRVEILGDGEPEIAVVGAIHGDEPCGANAVGTLLDENPPVDCPVKCIIANERALARGVRFVEQDLNRVFPGDLGAETYERRLAAALIEEVRDCRTLAFHSTQSTARPFAIVPETGPFAETVCPRLSVDALVEAGPCVGTALGSYVDTLEVECGLQGTEQASENATQLVREFLMSTGALPPTSEPRERALPVFQLQRSLPKPAAASYAVHVPNFERVETGTAYASVEDTALLAEEAFYPVLLSPEGYTEQFGYAAELTEYLGASRESIDGHVDLRDRQISDDPRALERVTGLDRADHGPEGIRE